MMTFVHNPKHDYKTCLNECFWAVYPVLIILVSIHNNPFAHGPKGRRLSRWD